MTMSSTGSEPLKRLRSLIRQARPKRALFTTFTLSLNWFEAVVVPALDRAGCEQIDLLVDARYAQKATDETASLYVGSRYRIIPIYLEKTHVFHPKVTYLQGADGEDHLLVSSANLTFSGHGRNLEVLDSVSSGSEPAVFMEFSDFLAELPRRYAFSVEHKEILDEYRAQAASHRPKAATSTVDRSAWLVHTLQRPAADQFIELAKEVEGLSALTVLSPFHAPTGQPVQAIADAMGVKSIRIGLNPISKTVAPFAKSNSFKIAPKYVRVDVPYAERPLHAKCFEATGTSEVLVMTGSVNATAQSLTSTKNVEISLVRRLNTSPFVWKPVATPKDFEACEFSVSELTAKSPALQVSLTATNHLVGLVHPAGPDKRVTLEIWDSDQCLYEQSDVPLSGGQFDVSLKGFVKPNDTALLLKMESDDLSATGWINVEAMLALDEEQRRLARSSQRLMSGKYSSADLAALFSWLASLQDHDKPPKPALKRPIGGKKGKEPAKTMSYEEWQRAIREAGTPGTRSSGLAKSTLDAAIRWINRDVLPQPVSPDDGKPENPPAPAPKPKPQLKFLGSDKDEFNTKKPEPPQEKPVEPSAKELETEATRQFHLLLNAIPKGLARDAASHLVPSLVELSGSYKLKSAHDLWKSSEEHRPAGDALALPLQSWLTQFSGFAYSEANRVTLLPFMATMACCAIAYNPDSSPDVLKECVERVGGRTLELGELTATVAAALTSEKFYRVFKDKDALAAHARTIEAGTSPSALLADIILRAMDDTQSSRPTAPNEYREVVDALLQHRENTRKPAFGVLASVDQRTVACPCCSSALAKDEIGRLRTIKALVCKGFSCRRPIFLGIDLASLSTLTGRFRG